MSTDAEAVPRTVLLTSSSWAADRLVLWLDDCGDDAQGDAALDAGEDSTEHDK